MYLFAQPGGQFIFTLNEGTASLTDTVEGDSDGYLRVRELSRLDSPMKSMKTISVFSKFYS